MYEILPIPSNHVTCTCVGIYYDQKLVMPIVITGSTQIFDFSNESATPDPNFNLKLQIITNSPTVFDQNQVPEPTFFPEERQLPYCSKNPSEAISTLKAWGLLNAKAKLYIAEFALAQAIDIFLQSHSCAREYTSDYTGWIHPHGSWLYLTSSFAITSNGIQLQHRCRPSCYHLKVDTKLNARDAFRQTWKLLQMDFSAATPVLCTAVLSLLSPLRQKHHLPPLPGLLIGGKPGTGKTQLAIHFARFLTHQSGTLDDVFLLQESARKFSQVAAGIRDSPLILDDFRLTGSQAIKQSAKTVLERTVHSSFQGTTGAPLTIITGETEALAHITESSKSRMLLLLIEESEGRSALIHQLKQNPKLVRTCVFHFIQFLAQAFADDTLAFLINDNDELFQQYLDNSKGSRLYDNLSLSFLAFRIFTYWGYTLHALTEAEQTQAVTLYGKTLTKLALSQKTNSPTEQNHLILAEIIRNLPIHIAAKDNYRYKRNSYEFLPSECCDTYGHHVILDMQHGYRGILLPEKRYVLGCERSKSSECLLIISYDDFCDEFKKLTETARHLSLASPNLSLKAFLKALRKDGILLAEDRHDPTRSNGLNYKIKEYPEYQSDQVHYSAAVYILRVPSELLRMIIKPLQANEQKLVAELRKQLPRGERLFYEADYHTILPDLQKCTSIIDRVF